MSCVRRDASRDRFGIAGILTNDGRGCLSREKFLVAIGESRKFGLRKSSVANGRSRVKFTILVARVSLVYSNARDPVM